MMNPIKAICRLACANTCKALILIAAVFPAAFCYGQWTEQLYEQYTSANYTDFPAFNEPVLSGALDAELMEAAIFYETNRQRVKYEKPELVFDHNLATCAHNYSSSMVEHNFFSHESHIAGEQTIGERLAAVGYPEYTCAENIAACVVRGTYAETARYLVAERWMKSKGHRANILRSSLTHLACGVAFYEEGGVTYIKATQDFLKKL